MSLKRAGYKNEKLFVSLKDRTVLVPLPNNEKPSKQVYAITMDGNAIYGRPTLTLMADTTYDFVIDCPGHPFYISSDSRGGGASRKPEQFLVDSIEIIPDTIPGQENTGVEKGVLTWTPEKIHSQMELYYQCNLHPDMGGQIIIK